MILAAVSVAAAIGAAPVQSTAPRPNPAPVGCPDVVYRGAARAARNCPPEVLMRLDAGGSGLQRTG